MSPYSAIKIAVQAACLTLAIASSPALSQTQEEPKKEPNPASQTAPAASSDQDYIDIAPQEVPREINEFKLSEDLLGRMEKVHEQLSKLQLSATEEEGQDPNPSVDQMVASIESRPQVVEVMKANNIAPRDYILGYFALMSALAAADAENEDQLINEAVNVNPDHLAFGKQFSERIRTLIGE